jgi:pilus assembly protein CpaC
MRALHHSLYSLLAVVLFAAAVNAAETPGKASSKVSSEPAQEQQSAQPVLAPETQSVHVEVGRSIILNTQSRLRRIVVSNPGVLDTTTVSPTQLVVTAKAPGSSSLVLWDESSNARIVDVYADVDISGLQEGIKSAYPRESVQVEAAQGRIVATGTVPSKAEADDILRMAGSYSKEVVNSLIIDAPRVKQIMLKVQFAEVDRTKLDQFGFNILSTGAANTPGSISTGQFGPPTLGGAGTLTNSIGATAQGFTTSLSASNLLNVFLFRPDLNLGATIQDLQQKNVLQILAEPNLMARSGEPAKFLAGGEFPFPVVQGGTGNAVAVTIQFKPFGVKLDFTGTIDGDIVRLKIAPEVSTLDFADGVTISGFSIPAISTRRSETEIDLRNGQSFGIAGLLDKRTTAVLSKMPGIGDIPILGQLFRSKSFTQANSELLVVVTPTIVDPLSENVPAPQLPTMPYHSLVDKHFDRTINPETTATPNNK